MPASTSRRSRSTKPKTKRSSKLTLPKAPPAAADTEAVGAQPLVGGFRLVGRALVVLKGQWRLFGLMALIYGMLELILAQQLPNLANIQLSLGLAGHTIDLGNSLSLYGGLVSTVSGTTSTAAWHFSILIIMSLLAIWALRQAWQATGVSVSLRRTLYGGTGQLVPFLILLVLILVQLIPMLLGAMLYASVVRNAIATSIAQQSVFLVILLGLAALSVYWLTRTVPALYVVTLDGMTPRKAYDDALQLVRGRRLSVARKLIFLPVALFVAAAIIIVPTILLLPLLAQWLFFVLTIAGFFVVHSYLYALYRELLNE